MGGNIITSRRPPVRAGADVYDAAGCYVGNVARVYPVPPRFAAADGRFGCFKVRRGPLPFGGPPPLLVPFDAVSTADDARVVLTVTRADAARWAHGRASS